MWRTNASAAELHARARIENGELLETEIACLRCGGKVKNS